MKGSAITDHLAKNAIENYNVLTFNFLNKDLVVLPKDDGTEEFNSNWKMYFDRVVNLSRNEISAIIIAPYRK